MKQGQVLHITFHNPNTDEETAKYLTKLIAENIAEKIIQKQAIRQYAADSSLPSSPVSLTM
ncbi:hypothetical protein [Caproiciproducens galactitolivorans]|uniref:hypothetical protein n=1 Tax=Caproiciproducens galactitolivorans TaxID=642589 RepID=UPI0024097028|nr:hypothetical protein [Caproiciproducens galactitolivorans]